MHFSGATRLPKPRAAGRHHGSVAVPRTRCAGSWSTVAYLGRGYKVLGFCQVDVVMYDLANTLRKYFDRSGQCYSNIPYYVFYVHVDIKYII